MENMEKRTPIVGELWTTNDPRRKRIVKVVGVTKEAIKVANVTTGKKSIVAAKLFDGRGTTRGYSPAIEAIESVTTMVDAAIRDGAVPPTIRKAADLKAQDLKETVEIAVPNLARSAVAEPNASTTTALDELPKSA